MRKIFKIFALSARAAFCLSGCGKDEIQQSETPVFQIEFADENNVTNYSDVGVYGDNSSEYAQDLLITVEGHATDFKYCKANVDIDEDGELVLNGYETLYEMKDFVHTTALVVRAELPEILPMNCIIYNDPNGVEHIGYIMQSGKDGSVYFME